jgi:hypothetical protein
LSILDPIILESSTQSTPTTPSSSPTPARKSLFPAASDVARHLRGVHQFPGEMAPLFPLFPSLFARCLASPNSDGTVAVLTEGFRRSFPELRRCFSPSFAALNVGMKPPWHLLHLR